MDWKPQELKEKWKSAYACNTELSEASLDYCVDRLRENMRTLAYACPSETAPGGHYNVIDNIAWTTGFWPGMLWTAYGVTKDETFLYGGKLQTKLFQQRLEDDCVLQHHDIGFLYTLSTVADYTMTGSETARQLGIQAAYRLMKMYRPVPGIFQRGGDLDDLPDRFTGVFIVDCMLNIPLLFWAAEQTGDQSLYDAAYRHAKNTIHTLIRPYGAVVHSGVADVKTGSMFADSSLSQGKGGDDAAWGRGQAWAIYGLPLAYSFTKDPEFLEAAKVVTNYFLNRLPSDDIANWDLYYTEDEAQRDTSAASIAVCGLLEHASHLPITDPYKEIYQSAAYRILDSLSKNYRTQPGQDTMGLLEAGVYQMSKGVNEPTIWGDYYYMEALWRMHGSFRRFW